MSTLKHDSENSNTRATNREVVQSAPLPRRAYSGPRPNRPSYSHHDQLPVPGTELRQFFSDRARRLADETEQGLPIKPRELVLLVEAARAILSFEAAA